MDPKIGKRTIESHNVSRTDGPAHQRITSRLAGGNRESGEPDRGCHHRTAQDQALRLPIRQREATAVTVHDGPHRQVGLWKHAHDDGRQQDPPHRLRREEVFARMYEAGTVRSRNFRIWVVGQSVHPPPKTTPIPKSSRKSARPTLYLPIRANAMPTDPLIPTKTNLTILHENNF
jgi:hypothetical protein